MPVIARGLGLKVAAEAWIGSDSTHNAAEISNLISAAKSGYVDMAIVGSEVLLRGDVSEAQLLSYMVLVRQAIPSTVPVTRLTRMINCWLIPMSFHSDG
jgi:exo-beta-1,3-glucanase (GH17 family)